MKLEGPVLYAWLAALIDGEGSVMLVRRKPYDGGHKRNQHYRPIVSVCNTKHELLDALAVNTGVSRIYEHRVNGPDDRPRARRMWTWRMVTSDIRQWMPLIRPYLILKGVQTDLLLEAVAIRLSTHAAQNTQKVARLDEIYARIRQLNTRGRTLNAQGRSNCA